MPPAKRKPAAANKVDVTVENQENPVTDVKDRGPEDTTSETPVAKAAPANEVDDTVKNQEAPGSIVTERESTNSPADAEFAKQAPAQEVDVTVVNQESLGAGEVVDRNPDPEIVENPVTEATYDVSKSSPELIDPDKDETEARRARLRQTSGVMNAKDIEGFEDEEDREETPKFSIEFLESGLTANGKVWKRGEILELEDIDQTRTSNEDTEGNVWYEQSASEQKERYGKVFFEKR